MTPAQFPGVCGLATATGVGESQESATERPIFPEYLYRALMHRRNSAVEHPARIGITGRLGLPSCDGPPGTVTVIG
jgi:hypothetical protein